MLREHFDHDYLTADPHCRYSILGGHPGEQRLYSLQMGDCIGSATRRYHCESIQRYDFFGSHRNPNNCRNRFFYR